MNLAPGEEYIEGYKVHGCATCPGTVYVPVAQHPSVPAECHACKLERMTKGNPTMARKKTPKPDPRPDGATFHKRYTTKLPVKREPDVLAALAQELAKNVRIRENLEEERRSMNAGFREKFAALADDEKRLATAVETGCTMEDVEVQEFIRRDQAIEIVRQDTGEIVEVRAADPGDLQEELPLDDDQKATDPAPPGDGDRDPTDTAQLAQEQAGA